MTSSNTDDADQALAWSLELFGEANPIAFMLAPRRFISATRSDDALAVTLRTDGYVGVTMGPHPPLDPRWSQCVTGDGLDDHQGPLTARGRWDFYTVRTFASETPPPVEALDDDELVTRLLTEHAPHSQVWPTNPEIVHWYAVRDERGALASLGAVVRWESGLHVVSSVMTVRELRGRGSATALMRGVIHQTHREGVEWLGLGVDHANHAAQHVYRSVGFVVRAHFTTYGRD